MKKIAVIVADGTEEIEALVPVDVLRRASVDCVIVAVGKDVPIGSHGIKLVPDAFVSQTDFSLFDGIVIPGGMPGAVNISKDGKIVETIKTMKEKGKLVAAICASPAVVLSKNGVLSGEEATCYPSADFVEQLKINAVYKSDSVVTTKNVITANGPRAAFDFAFVICEYLGVTPKF